MQGLTIDYSLDSPEGAEHSVPDHCHLWTNGEHKYTSVRAFPAACFGTKVQSCQHLHLLNQRLYHE